MGVTRGGIGVLIVLLLLYFAGKVLTDGPMPEVRFQALTLIGLAYLLIENLVLRWGLGDLEKEYIKIRTFTRLGKHAGPGKKEKL